MTLMATSGTPLLSRAWRFLAGAAFVFGLQLYFGGWWLDGGDERVLTGFLGAAVVTLLAANSIGRAFWVWLGIMCAMWIMLEILKSDIFPIVLFFGGAIMGMGVAVGWAIRELVAWVVHYKKGRAV